MDLSQFHFAQPVWLWLGAALPLVWLAYVYCYRPFRASHRLDTFIDSHLLPYLLVNPQVHKKAPWKKLAAWSLVWACLIVALAGPRWTFRELERFSNSQGLVILLDLSESMNATDVKPSRLAKGKQKIEDLLNSSQGVKIGLIAFAADPHMIAPLTDDKETLRHLLPTLDTDLVYVQGSRLSSAIEMAKALLASEESQALLIISDGGFEDASAITTAKSLAEKGVVIHTLGIGTVSGAPLHDRKGNVIKKNGAPLLSKLESDKLREISKVGKGHYLESEEVTVILDDLAMEAKARVEAGKKTRLWDERFYLFLIPILPVLLWWFRRGALFGISFMIFGTQPLEANDYFKNREQQGKAAFDEGDYEAALDAFQDCYRKGVASYRAGKFAEAEEMFRQNSREEVASHSGYNLGNALVQQQKLKEAITAYEDVLKRWPDHTKAKDNLEIVKKMLEEQHQQQQQDKEQQEDNDSSESDSENQQEQQDQQENNEQDENGSESKEEDSQPEQKETESQQEEAAPEPKESEPVDTADKDSPSEQEQDADLWLNQIESDPKKFMQNKFYIESKKNGTKEGLDPW